MPLQLRSLSVCFKSSKQIVKQVKGRHIAVPFHLNHDHCMLIWSFCMNKLVVAAKNL